MLIGKADFPSYSGVRCLMMPYIQGDPDSVPSVYQAYRDIIASVFIRRGDVGYLTIDESEVKAGSPHRGQRAKHGRAIHTEAGKSPHHDLHCWGGTRWGESHVVTLDFDTEVVLANNLDNSCALWNATHFATSLDGDIGDKASDYPYEDAVMMRAGEVHKIGILTPHESLPVRSDFKRQFLRIVSSGVHGREEYFTVNPLMGI